MEPTTEDAEPRLTGEDAKLVVLARATRSRTTASAGAGLRDTDGRTYAGASVELPSLRVSAIGSCIAMAVAGGSSGAEAVVLLGGDHEAGPVVPHSDLDAVRDFAGPGVPVYRVTPAGAVLGRATT